MDCAVIAGWPSLVREGIMFELDKIDTSLLQSIAQNPGQRIIEYIRPLLADRSVRTLYERVCMLAVQGLITIERDKKYALLKITEKGREAITGREESHPEARSS